MTTATPRATSVARLRPATEDDWDALDAVLSEAYGREQPAEIRAVQREVFEFDRALVAEDGQRICGCLSAFSLSMSVAGGIVPVAGVTWGGVLPTHRRRGILTLLQRRQLDEIHALGREPVAALFTTEPSIYGRYGFGVASLEMSLTIPRDPRALQDTPADPEIWLESVDPVEALPDVEPVYSALVPRRPGSLVRNHAWARHVIADAPATRRGFTRLRCVLARRGETVLGYVRYATLARTDHGVPAGTVRVRDIAAVEPAAYAALWRYVLDMDLTSVVSVGRLPVDDALPHLLTNPRAARPTLTDQLHLRLVDVGRALSGRSYSADIDVVLSVDDPFCPWNTGRWRLSADRTGARCEPTREPADLHLGARELGSLYLGGFTLRALAEAGRVQASRDAVLATVSHAFSSESAPFCPYRF